MTAAAIGAPSLAALLMVAAGLAVQPQEKALPDPGQRPATRTSDCTQGGCHAEQVRFRFLHAPVAVGACEMCHSYEKPSEHTFQMKHTGAAMCDFCHIGKSAPGDASRVRTVGTARDLGAGLLDGLPLLHIHEPVREGECTACHDPHGSDIRRLVRHQSTGDLCLSCHESVAAHEHLHTPVVDGDCISCHRPHSSILPKLLVNEGRDLCLGCHSEVTRVDGIARVFPSIPQVAPLAQAIALANEARARGLTHEPVLGECSECHDVHGAAQTSLLKQEIGTLCGSCHEDVARTATTASVPHSAVTEKAACLNCHGPHQSMRAHLLRDTPVKLCLDCHSEPIMRKDGSRIADMSLLSQSGLQLHGPLSDGLCQGCHQVHGGSRTALLSANYSPELYQAFSEQAYELCFTCHDADLARVPQTTATSFRNGSTNLHYIHISAQDENGRSCRLCHTPHAGASYPRLHEQVAYGQWQVPIRYEGTESGGTCAAGCHRPRSYDRYNPVVNDPELAPTPSAQPTR